MATLSSKASREDIAAALVAVLTAQRPTPASGQQQLGRPPPEPVYSHVEKIGDDLWRGFDTQNRVWKFVRHAANKNESGDDAPDANTPGWYIPEHGTPTLLGITPWKVRRTPQGAYEYFDSSMQSGSIPSDDVKQKWLTKDQFREQAAVPRPVPDAPPGWWVKIIDGRQWAVESDQVPSSGSDVTGWLPAEEAIKKITNEKSEIIDALAEFISMYPELGDQDPEEFDKSVREKFGL